MLHVWDDEYPKYIDLIITHCMHVSKYHTYPVNMYNYQQKNRFLKCGTWTIRIIWITWEPLRNAESQTWLQASLEWPVGSWAQWIWKTLIYRTGFQWAQNQWALLYQWKFMGHFGWNNYWWSASGTTTHLRAGISNGIQISCQICM